MSLYITLPEVNKAHVETIVDELWYAGWDEFNTYYKDDGRRSISQMFPVDDYEKIENLSDSQLEKWDNGKAFDVYPKILFFAKDRFSDNGVWSKKVNEHNVDDYNQAMRDIIHDVEYMLWENLCDFAKVTKTWLVD